MKSSYTTNGDSKPLMLILTDSSLYVTSTKANNTFYNNFIMPYIELNTILIGPNAQVIHFSNYDKDMQIIVTTGCANITGDIISKLEMAMRKDVNKPQLPAVKQINMRDMVNLRKAICKQTAVDKVSIFCCKSTKRLIFVFNYRTRNISIIASSIVKNTTRIRMIRP